MYQAKLYNSLFHIMINYYELTSCIENSGDPDQLASQEPADLDIHCLQEKPADQDLHCLQEKPADQDPYCLQELISDFILFSKE